MGDGDVRTSDLPWVRLLLPYQPELLQTGGAAAGKLCVQSRARRRSLTAGRPGGPARQGSFRSNYWNGHGKARLQRDDVKSELKMVNWVVVRTA